MVGFYVDCPNCGHSDLDPRTILIGMQGKMPEIRHYQEIITLKCSQCGWLGEHLQKQA